MNLRTFITLIFIMFTLGIYSQENPKIDRKELIPRADSKKEVNKNLKKGNQYYASGIYDAALTHYLKLYDINDLHSPLNYRIGVSYLNGTNPKNALRYFIDMNPAIVSDYEYQIGIAYLYNLKYSEAKESFTQYLNLLPKGKQKKMSAHIKHLMEVCDFSQEAVNDSVPVFIINMGPYVNSYYDEYSSVEFASNLYFTSRRPKRDVQEITGHSDFKERIFKAPLFLTSTSTGEAFLESTLESKKHTSVSGVDNANENLLYYKGKKRSGGIYAVSFKEKNGKIEQSTRFKNKFDKVASKETSATISDIGDLFYISDRRGGVGGKDIWFAERKKKNRYYRPVNMSEINTPLDEEGVYVTPDGNTLYFSSNGRPGMGGFDVYKTEKDDEGNWSVPVNMGYPINSPDDDLFYRPTSDPIYSMLSSKRQGGFGGLDLYFVKKDLRIPFELVGNVTDIASGANLKATVTLFNQNNRLPVGIAYNDSIEGFYSLKMEDGGDFYVQVDAPGYRSITNSFECPTKRHERIEKNFSLEKLLFPYTIKGYVYDLKTARPVQAEIILKPQGEETQLYRTVSDINSGFYSITIEDKADLDMIVSAENYFDRNEVLLLKNEKGSEGDKNISLQRSIATYTLTGVITDEDSDVPVKGKVSAFKPGEAGSTDTESDEETGKYELNLADAGPYLLEVTGEGYFFVNDVLQYDADSTLLLRNFKLKKLQSGAKIVIENILFNTGNATLKPESFTELNKLVNLLRENPDIRIEVSGHTDNTGSAATNKNLSKSRALSVRNYLTSQGIAVNRIEYEGYGYDFPIADNNTAEGRAENRRVEMKVIE